MSGATRLGRIAGGLACAVGVVMPTAASATVFAWGSNGNGTGAQVSGALGTGTGQFGPGECTEVPAQSDVPWPVHLPPRTQVSAVAAGLNRGYALTTTGRVIGWGDYGTGRGVVTQALSTCWPTAVDVRGTGDEQLVVAGIAPTAKGTIFIDSPTDPNRENGAGSSAGTDVHGELLLGGPGARQGDLPLRNRLGGFPEPQRPFRIASGVAASVVLDVRAGTLTAWGSDARGEHGAGGGSPDSHGGVPVPLPSGTVVTQVAAGPHFFLALTDDGKVYAWGANESGQMGDGRGGPVSRVVAVPFPPGVRITQIAAGGDPGVGTETDADGFGLALSSTGAVYGWGTNRHGQLANGSTSADPVPPRQITNLPAGASVEQLAAGAQQGYVVTTSGALYSWGGARYGLLGRPRRSDDPTPRSVFTGDLQARVRSVGAQAVSHSAYALTDDLTVASPTVAAQIQNTSAALRASITVPEGATVGTARCGFALYNRELEVPCAPSAGDTAQFGGTVGDLTPADVHLVRAFALIGGTRVDGGSSELVTTAPAPRVTTDPAANVGQSGALLGGHVDIAPEQRAFREPGLTTCRFEYSTDPAFRSDVASIPVAPRAPGTGCVGSDNRISAAVDQLTPNTTYHARTVFLAPRVFPGPAYGNTVTFTTASTGPAPSPIPGPTPGPAPAPVPSPDGPPNGPPGPGPAPGPPSGDRLSPTRCLNQTRKITAAGGALQVTGCLYGDNKGHFIVEGTSTINGITVSASGNRQQRPVATFACEPADTSCNDLLTTYAQTTRPALLIDVPNLRMAGNGAYTLATGSTTLFEGVLESPDGGGTGASFDPRASGQAATSGPALYLASRAGRHLHDLHGLPIAGPVVIAPQPTGGALMTLQVGLPSLEDIAGSRSLSGSSAATGSATLAVSASGAENLRALTFDVPSLSIPKTSINFGQVGFSFNLDTNSWTAQTGFKLPGFDYLLHVKIVIESGAFKSIDGSAENLNKPIPATGGAVVLDTLRAGFAFSPVTVSGGISLLGGPKINNEAALQLDGDFRAAFGDTVTLRSPLTAPGGVTYTNVPLSLNVAGTLTLVKGLPIPVSLGSANATLLAGIPNRFYLGFSGGLGPLGGDGCDPRKPTPACSPQGYKLSVGGVDLAEIDATVHGTLVGGTNFNAHGSGRASVMGLALQAEALISTVGMVVCARVGLPTARAAGRSGEGHVAARAFAAAAAAAAAPLATEQLAAAERRRRIRRIEADMARTRRSAGTLVRDAKRAVAGIVATDRRRTQRVVRSASADIRGAVRGYGTGRTTVSHAKGALLESTNEAAAGVQGAGVAAQDRLAALQQQVITRLERLAQRLAADEARLQVLRSGRAAGASAATPPRAVAAFSFSSAFSSVGDAFSSAYSSVASLAETARKRVEDTINAAISEVRPTVLIAGVALIGPMNDLRKAFTVGMSEFVAKSKQLGVDSSRYITQVAVLVKDGVIELYNYVADLLSVKVGVGYKWGGTPSLYMGGGCAIGPFKDTAGIASLRAGGSPRTFRLSAGPAFTVLRFVGDGAPPLVEVTGPGGAVMTTPTAVDAEVQRGGTAVVIRDPTTNTTFVQFRPETGTYTAALQPGSVAVTSATTSESLPSPSITASVSGRGTRRVLRWRATRIAGQQLTFTVRGAAGLREITTTNATSGSKRFTVPAGLPGISTVSARVRQDGFDRATLDVASFSAPVARPPKAPRGLSIQRKGLTARIRWAKVAGAVSYAVQVSTTGGARSVTTQQQPSLVLPRTLPSDTVAVQVTALDASGQRSASATRTSQGRAASACLAPAKVTVVLKARSSLSSAVALLNGRPAAANRTGAKRLSVPLAGITGRKATLVVKARTRSGRAIAGRHVYALCAGRTVPARLVLPLR